MNYGAGSIAYFRQVESPTQFVVHTATGGTPGSVSHLTVNSITRTFNTILAAETQTELRSSSARFR